MFHFFLFANFSIQTDPNYKAHGDHGAFVTSNTNSTWGNATMTFLSVGKCFFLTQHKTFKKSPKLTYGPDVLK